MKRILVVCTANVCRSPMAMGVLRRKLAAAGLAEAVDVQSAGVDALTGQAASPPAIELLAEQGIDLRSHRAKQLEESDLNRVDLVLVMEEAHRQQAFYYNPAGMHKILLFSELVGEHTDLADPYGQSTAVYRDTLAKIEDTLDRGWPRLLAKLKLPVT